MATQDREDVQSTKPRAAGSRSMNESSSDLDRVRDILFGERVRDQDRRLESLRDELVQKLQSDRDAAQKRMDDMETQWRSEVASLEQKLEADSSKRGAEHSELQSTLASEIAALATRMESGLRELKLASDSSLLEITERLQKENRELRAELGARSAELSENKADRTVLSELLTDLASRLNDRPGDGATSQPQDK